MTRWAELCEAARESKPLRRGETMKLIQFVQMFLNSRDIETAARELRALPEKYGYAEGSRDWRYYNGLADMLEALNAGPSILGTE